MKKSLRLALLVCAGFAGLAFAGPALAKYDPSLTIEQSSYKLGAPTTLDVFIAISDNADPTAQLRIFAPAGYSANLTAAPGTKIGAVIAFVRLRDLADAVVPVSGDVVVANPTDPSIQAAAARCPPPPGVTNQAIWVLNATLQGQALAIPVFVYKLGPLVVQQVCLAPPDVPSGTPGRAPFGAQLVLADFTVKGVFRNAATKNGYEWAGIFTPYVPGAGTPNAAGTLEWRTFVGLPSSLTLAKARTKKGIKLVGRLSVEGVSARKVRLSLYGGKKPKPAPNATSSGSGKRVAVSAKKGLPATGKYAFARPQVKFTTFFQTRFEGYGFDECDPGSPTGVAVPCKGEDIAAVTSNQVKAVKPKKKRRR